VWKIRVRTPKDVQRSFGQAPSLEMASQVGYSFNRRTSTPGDQLVRNGFLSSVIEYGTVVQDTASAAEDGSLR
jgi:hypothetical protein